MKRQINIADICDALSLNYEGDNIAIQALYLAGRETAYTSVLSYATEAKWVEKLTDVRAVNAVVIQKADMPDYIGGKKYTWIFSDEPEQTFFDIHDYLIDNTDFYGDKLFDTIIGMNCQIHPTAIIEPGVKLGNNVKIGPLSVLMPGTQVGDNTVIESGVVIGEDGFQIIRSNGVNRAIRHCGRVQIGSNVHIGAHTVIHRSLFEGATVIESDAKLDTLVYVAHNCFVGENAVITSGVTLCGSAVINAGAWVGVNSSVINKVVLGENSIIGAGSVVTRDVVQKTLVYGVPAKKKR